MYSHMLYKCNFKVDDEKYNIAFEPIITKKLVRFNLQGKIYLRSS